jgi:FkbM family methyltransferase
MRKKATKMLKFIEKAFAETFDIEQKFTPKPTAMRAMAVVKARAEAYIYGTCSQFLWMRPIGAGATEQWVKLGRAPTETVDLCYHDAARQLYSVDMYGSMWVMDLAAESPSWASIEATKGAKLCAITVLDGVLYGATSKKIVQRPVSAAGWKDLLTPSGEVLEAHDVVGLAAQDGKLYAYNDADELWSLELDLRADWELLAGALLPGTNGLCLSGVHMLSANFDTLWERPLAAVNCFTIKGSLPQSDVKVTRRVAKTPSRMLKYDRTQQGNKKPILGIYTNSEYRKPSKGFDLPEVGRAVLDLGAHIGWFTLWCLDNGASSVIAVEATPQSHGFHAANFKDDPRVTSIHAAAVSQASFDQSPTATFRIAPMGNTWRNCLDKYTYWNEKTTATMGSVTVPCVSVPQLLKEHPEVHMVKIDIEGSEMELLEEIVWPEHVEYLVFEYSVGTRCCHLACPGCVEKGCPPTCSKVRFPPIREKLEAQGFYVQFAPSYWSVITGKKSAVYDEIIFCKRVQAPQQHLIGMNVD